MNNPFDTIDARLSNIENLLLDLKHAPKEISPGTSAHPSDQIRTRTETAKILHVTLATLNEYTKTGKIVANRIGNRVLYRDSDIHAALNKVKTSNIAV